MFASGNFKLSHYRSIWLPYFLHEQKGYVKPARNFDISQARHEWALVVDADKRVSPGLAQWIEMTLQKTSASASRIPQCNHYGDQ